MSEPVVDKIQYIRDQRDSKIRAHLSQYAPVWIVDEEVIPDEEAVLFDVVFAHPSYGWVSRRYRFDAFNQVLYHMGQRGISEERVFDLETKSPFIAAASGSTVDAYGG